VGPTRRIMLKKRLKKRCHNSPSGCKSRMWGNGLKGHAH